MGRAAASDLCEPVASTSIGRVTKSDKVSPTGSAISGAPPVHAPDATELAGVATPGVPMLYHSAPGAGACADSGCGGGPSSMRHERVEDMAASLPAGTSGACAVAASGARAEADACASSWSKCSRNFARAEPGCGGGLSSAAQGTAEDSGDDMVQQERQGSLVDTSV